MAGILPPVMTELTLMQCPIIANKILILKQFLWSQEMTAFLRKILMGSLIQMIWFCKSPSLYTRGKLICALIACTMQNQVLIFSLFHLQEYNSQCNFVIPGPVFPNSG
jgi:hypothetical protein